STLRLARSHWLYHSCAPTAFPFFFIPSYADHPDLHSFPTRRSSDLGLAIDSTVDIFTFYVPHRHVYGEQWIKFMKDGVNALFTKIGRAVQQECRDRSRMPSSA